MARDPKLTERINKWLLSKPEERDIEEGALLLLKLTGNRIMYQNILRNPKRFGTHLEYQLQKFYNFRVKEITHDEVEEMQRKVDKIVKKEKLDKPAIPKMTYKGKRPDHDQLPDEIKQKYADNLPILQKMRDLHLKLRNLSLADHPCPDSERYPFLKELIKLDKLMHSNWKEYDSYINPEK